jgi:hypothetical protein
VSTAADRLEQLGGYLERVDGRSMLDDVERFARTRPWVVAGVAAAAGFAASRVLRASSESRYDRSYGTRSSSGQWAGEQWSSEPEWQRGIEEGVGAGTASPSYAAGSTR